MLLQLDHLNPRQRHLIGVSGGRDSVALLHCLHARGYTKLIVCHVNHKLRGRDATNDARFVQALANRLGYVFEGIAIDVAKEARAKKRSVETCAREVRHAFFADIAKRHHCPRVILAHHAEDQAETVLMRVLRGTGIAGLAGMKSASDMIVGKRTLSLLRPMLHVRRCEIDAYIAAHQIEYREDASNTSAEHTRNRVRLELLPLVSAAVQRDVTPLLNGLSTIAAREDDFMHAAMIRLIEEQALFADDGSLVLRPALKQAHLALQHRVLHHWLRERHVCDIDNDLVTRAVRLLTEHDPARLNLPGALQLRRKAGHLRIANIAV
jgi:tRNA(Ile)-lysidine synthase